MVVTDIAPRIPVLPTARIGRPVRLAPPGGGRPGPSGPPAGFAIGPVRPLDRWPIQDCETRAALRWLVSNLALDARAMISEAPKESPWKPGLGRVK